LNCRYLLSLLIAATCSLNVQAESTNSDRWFDIELLVFKRNVDIHKISEQLDQNNVYLKQRDRVEVLKAQEVTNCATDQLCLHAQNPIQITENEIVDGEHRLKLLDSSQLQLTEQLNKLEAHELFKPLIHVAWRMPIQNEKNALPIHLFAGENYALDVYKEQIVESAAKKAEITQVDIDAITQAATANIAGTTSLEENNIEKLDVLASLQKQKTIQDLYEIDGNLLIYVERYLYVDGQLIVRTETQKEVSATSASVLASQEIDETELPAVEIIDQAAVVNEVETKTAVTETLFDQKRRLRSEEIHYLDHPLFGVIVQIRKIPADELAVLNAESEARAQAEAELNTISITQ